MRIPNRVWRKDLGPLFKAGARFYCLTIPNVMVSIDPEQSHPEVGTSPETEPLIEYPEIRAFPVSLTGQIINPCCQTRSIVLP